MLEIFDFEKRQIEKAAEYVKGIVDMLRFSNIGNDLKEFLIFLEMNLREYNIPHYEIYKNMVNIINDGNKEEKYVMYRVLSRLKKLVGRNIYDPFYENNRYMWERTENWIPLTQSIYEV